MAFVKLYGVQNVNFDSSEGKHIEGIKLHYGCTNKNVYGEKVDTKFLSTDSCRNLNIDYKCLCDCVGETLDIQLDMSGSVSSISLSQA